MEAYEPTWGSVTKINKNKNDTHPPPLLCTKSRTKFRPRHFLASRGSHADLTSRGSHFTRISRGSHFTRISLHADLARISRGVTRYVYSLKGQQKKPKSLVQKKLRAEIRGVNCTLPPRASKNAARHSAPNLRYVDTQISRHVVL